MLKHKIAMLFYFEHANLVFRVQQPTQNLKLDVIIRLIFSYKIFLSGILSLRCRKILKFQFLISAAILEKRSLGI